MATQARNGKGQFSTGDTRAARRLRDAQIRARHAEANFKQAVAELHEAQLIDLVHATLAQAPGAVFIEIDYLDRNTYEDGSFDVHLGRIVMYETEVFGNFEKVWPVGLPGGDQDTGWDWARSCIDKNLIDIAEVLDRERIIDERAAADSE